ncbi:GntR family transcriptional regulator [Benzoatithermus flavus]|uniref:GntR family transcriptional regulator n=1 Tax=Benzoatithermus flavus TaxID=3108223 RepID=A0ABU8XRS6_9PROT
MAAKRGGATALAGDAAARPLPYRPVARATVQDQVHRQLEALILDGEIEPGATVTIQGLAEAFGVSAMPVREALHRLTAAGALTVVAGRSVGIPPLSVERLMDLKRVRVEVEGLAAEWAAARCTPALLARLDALIAEMESSTAEADRRSFVPANREFHFAIYRAAGSETLMSLIEPLWLRIGPYLGLLRGSGNWRTANRQHRLIRDALARGDGSAARAALRADIEEAALILARLLEG